MPKTKVPSVEETTKDVLYSDTLSDACNAIRADRAALIEAVKERCAKRVADFGDWESSRELDVLDCSDLVEGGE